MCLRIPTLISSILIFQVLLPSQKLEAQHVQVYWPQYVWDMAHSDTLWIHPDVNLDFLLYFHSVFWGHVGDMLWSPYTMTLGRVKSVKDAYFGQGQKCH